MYEVFYWPTPNGKKVTILLEELGAPYKITPVNISRGDQFTDDFLRMNPNHRMPVLVDHAPADGGAPLSVFESGAIMLYLAEKEGRFWPQDLRTKTDVLQWVVWQMANQGPKLGECGHFRRLGDREGDQSYAVRRFTDEANRLYGVLNHQLAAQPYICGSDYTVADMICFPWAVNHAGQGQTLDDFPYMKRWFETMMARPGVQRGLAVGADLSVDATKLPPEEQARIRALLYNQRARPVPAWRIG